MYANRPEEAIPHHEKALAIKSRRLPPDHPDLGISVNNLGEALMKTGRFDEARPLIERGVAIAEATLGPEHLTTGMQLHTLGELYRLTGEARARATLERAAAIEEHAVASSHPEVANVYISLAQLGRAEGNLDGAMQYYRRALAVRERTLGATHALTLQTRQELEALGR
jgi:tetratricopeptide (TPR) repeat protein